MMQCSNAEWLLSPNVGIRRTYYIHLLELSPSLCVPVSVVTVASGRFSLPVNFPLLSAAPATLPPLCCCIVAMEHLRHRHCLGHNTFCPLHYKLQCRSNFPTPFCEHCSDSGHSRVWETNIDADVQTDKLENIFLKNQSKTLV